jgi:calcium binding protein 39
MSSFISQITHRKKTPDKLVRLCAKCLGDLCNNAIAPTPFLDSKQLTDTQDELCKRLSQMKAILYGSEEKVEVDEEKALELCASIQQDGLMLALIANLNILPFEGRKDASQIFNNLIHKNINNFVSYMRDNIASVFTLIDSYALPDVALCCGSMLRECIRHDDLARLILASNNFWKLFDSYVDLPNFEVASDAFNTLKDLLTTTRNKSISADFLEQNYDKVFPKYEILLSSENYVTRRRSLKLLGELLLDRRFAFYYYSAEILLIKLLCEHLCVLIYSATSVL